MANQNGTAPANRDDQGRFRKGISGNPNGRPSVDREIKLLAQEYGPRCVERLSEWLESDNPKASIPAAIALLERGYGKPTQRVELDVDDVIAQLCEERGISEEAAGVISLEARRIAGGLS